MLNLLENEKFDLLFAPLADNLNSLYNKATSAINASHQTVESLNSGGSKNKWTKLQGKGVGLGLGITVAATSHTIGDASKRESASILSSCEETLVSRTLNTSANASEISRDNKLLVECKQLWSELNHTSCLREGGESIFRSAFAWTGIDQRSKLAQNISEFRDQVLYAPYLDKQSKINSVVEKFLFFFN